MNKTWEKVTKKRYKDFKGYKFDRWIFQIVMLIIFCYLGFVAWNYNFDLDYFKCDPPPGEKCFNPFYENANWKNIELLPAGEYGFQPNFWYKMCWWGTIVVLILAFALNHFVWNRKFGLLKKMGEIDTGEKI